MLAAYEILGRLYSMKNSIITFQTTPAESVQLIQDLIDDMEEKL